MKRFAIAALVLAHMTACSTVAHGPHERIQVRTNPGGADAVIECAAGVRESGVTPAHIAIPRHAEGCVLTLSRAGMVAQRLELPRDVSGKYRGALWTGIAATAATAYFLSRDSGNGLIVLPAAVGVFGLASAAIDAMSGRRWLHEPDEIEVDLQPAP